VVLNLRVNFSNAADDSFPCKLDNGAWATQNNETTSGWTTLSPASFNGLSAGNHTLQYVHWLPHYQNRGKVGVDLLDPALGIAA